MGEVDDGPGSAGGATGDGEDEQPGKEEEQDVGGLDTEVHEPLRVLVHINRRCRLHVVGHPSPPHPDLSMMMARNRSSDLWRGGVGEEGWEKTAKERRSA